MAQVAQNSSAALGGVLLLSDIFLLNNSAPEVFFVTDETQDSNSALYLVLPYCILMALAVFIVHHNTDEDGYVTGRRTLESEFPFLRVITTVLTYGLECLQVCAVSFGEATTKKLRDGARFRDFFGAMLWDGEYKLSFQVVAILWILMAIVLFLPFILYMVLSRQRFEKVKDYLRGTKGGRVINFLQDFFLIYVPVAMMVALLRGVPCDYFATGERARAPFDDVDCWGETHRQYSAAGMALAIAYWGCVLPYCVTPLLIRRSTDQAHNGRFIGLSFAAKTGLAVVYVVTEKRHRWYQLAFVFLLQCCLLFFNINSRPSLVERMNFHRTVGYAIAVIASVMCFVAAGLDDEVSPVPGYVGGLGIAVLIVAVVAKYFFFVSNKVFPPMPFEEGQYEGGICLGLGVRHGHGSTTWSKEDKIFTGGYLFNRPHGYGVLTQGKLFFQGKHKHGKREGFGVTNIMPNEDESSFEGFYHNGVYHGQGTKKWLDDDVYEGYFRNGAEHGIGKWSYNSSIGAGVATGHWKEGIYLGVDAYTQEGQEYVGDIRFGVPHGNGTLTVQNVFTYEGEWRAGLQHGHGTATYHDGAKYVGYWKCGAFSGHGEWVRGEERYEGQWDGGHRHGKGHEEKPDGVYDGMFVRDERQGYGVFQHVDGVTVYQGSWRHNMYNGRGQLVDASGTYNGPWLRNVRHGADAHMIYANGIEHHGGWLDGKYDGHGALIVPKVGEFSGRFLNGMRHGPGKFTFVEQSEYVGEWRNNLLDGPGRLVFTSRASLELLPQMSVDEDMAFKHLSADAPKSFLDKGGIYDGVFAAGLFEGGGKVVSGDGTVYQGDWSHNLPHGTGTLTYPGGGEYTGEWREGLRDGFGVMTYVDKRVYAGDWQANKRHGHGVLKNSAGEVLMDTNWFADIPQHTNSQMNINASLFTSSDISADAVAMYMNAYTGSDTAVIPPIDVEDLLLELMPSAGSHAEILETRTRRVMELEEKQMRSYLLDVRGLELNERQSIRYMAVRELESLARARVLADEKEQIGLHEKGLLAKVLNAWKTQFRLNRSREPKKSDLVGDKSISSVYKRYVDLCS